MTDDERELLAAVELGQRAMGPREGEKVRVSFSSAAWARWTAWGIERRGWERVGPGVIVGRVEQLRRTGPQGAAGTVMIYGERAVAALRFDEITRVEPVG